jgi:hypothetical protein
MENSKKYIDVPDSDINRMTDAVRIMARWARFNPSTQTEVEDTNSEPTPLPVKINVHDPKDISAPVVEAVDKLTEHFDKVFPIGKIKTLLPKDCPGEEDGFWESQKKYADRTGYKENSLRTYRQKSNCQGIATDRSWGIDKKENIFKKVGDKSNSTYMYLVFHNSDCHRRFLLRTSYMT